MGTSAWWTSGHSRAPLRFVARPRPAAAPREGTSSEGVDDLRRAGFTALALLAALNIVDVVTTRLLLSRGGIELNPVADRLLASNTTHVVKLGIVAALTVHFMRSRPRLTVVCLMWFVVGIYVLVIAVNGSQLIAVWDK